MSTKNDFDFSNLSIDQLEQIRIKLEKREQEIADSQFIEVFDKMKSLKVSASAMIEYLTPLAELDGVLIKYTYLNEKNKQNVFLYKDGKKGANRFKDDIVAGKLDKEQALSFALNDAGKAYVETLFPKTAN